MDQVITENIILAGIIYFAVYLEQWIHMRSELELERKTAKNVIIFIKDDSKKDYVLLKSAISIEITNYIFHRYVGLGRVCRETYSYFLRVISDNTTHLLMDEVL